MGSMTTCGRYHSACCQLASVPLHQKQGIRPGNVCQPLAFSAGKDLIADSIAQPRSTTKPTFGPNRRAAPASARHSTPRPAPLPEHQSQQPSQGLTEQDAIEERRQSGQTASTSQQDEHVRGRPGEPGSQGGRSPRGSSPNSPFASITMRDGRHSRAPARKPISTVRASNTLTHAASDRQTATQHVDQSLSRHSEDLPAQSKDMHRKKKTHSRQSSSHDGLATHKCSSSCAVQDTTQAVTLAEAPSQLDLTAQGQQGQPGMRSTSSSSTPVFSKVQPVVYDAEGRCRGSLSHLVRLSPNVISDVAEQPSWGEGGSIAAALSDDTVNGTADKHGRRRKGGTRPRKPGPSAFPQLPYERSLLLQQSAASPVDEHNDALPYSASDTAQQTSAQTDILADAMQQRLQLQEHRAEGGGLGEGQGGPQQRMSQHGGYMQRGGRERLPCRRTTRSMLRGADTQTGEKLLNHHQNLSQCS
ncbi:hypothetical protein ABBQ38_009777 [Trebouxia sp. C0009 RCD-2024]